MAQAITPPYLLAALLLCVAGAAKFRAPGAAGRALNVLGLPGSSGLVRAFAAGELALGLWSALHPGRLAAGALAGVYGLFVVVSLALTRRRASCGCFGDDEAPASFVQSLLSGGLALVALAAVPAEPHGLGWVFDRPAWAFAVLMIGIGGSVYATVLLHRDAPRMGLVERVVSDRRQISERLASSVGALLERRLSRRGALARAALAGSAFAVAPIRYLIRPEAAWAVIRPQDCASGRCRDGYTAFCCEIEHGRNTCPNDTYVAGWWKCTNYEGGGLCHGDGVRYYLDCNRIPGHQFPGGCQCANGDCGRRRVDCNHFRYGQCNTQVEGTTEVVCRLVICQNPATVDGLNCNGTLMVDDNTCGHEAGCLAGLAVQSPGGGGL